jgi:hypothetical protein
MAEHTKEMSMSAETSNARGDDLAERQAWYEQQIALAECLWAAAFLDRWECGDDVPSKEYYVALWLAARAAPPLAATRGDVRGLVDKLVDAAYQDGMQGLDVMSNETLSARSALEQALIERQATVPADPRAAAEQAIAEALRRESMAPDDYAPMPDAPAPLENDE